jgi:hypothetical protein
LKSLTILAGFEPATHGADRAAAQESVASDLEQKVPGRGVELAQGVARLR